MLMATGVLRTPPPASGTTMMVHPLSVVYLSVIIPETHPVRTNNANNKAMTLIFIVVSYAIHSKTQPPITQWYYSHGAINGNPPPWQGIPFMAWMVKAMLPRTPTSPWRCCWLQAGRMSQSRSVLAHHQLDRTGNGIR